MHSANESMRAGRKHHYDCGIHFCNRLRMDCPDDSDFFCSYGERKDGGVE